MMPPKHPKPPMAPGEPYAPYPHQTLSIGGGRWLTPTGLVLTEEPHHPCELQPETLWFWEAAAAKGGYVLGDLII